MNRYGERAIFSSLSMKTITRIPEALQPMVGPSDWRNSGASKVKYMFLRMMVSRSSMSCFVRWRIRLFMLLTVLVIASWTGTEVYRTETSRLHGYDNSLLVVKLILFLTWG